MTPGCHLRGVGRFGTPQACLSAMSAASSSNRYASRLPSRLAPLPNAFPFHIGDLRQDGDDQLSHASAIDLAQQAHIDRDAQIDKTPNGPLYVECVTSKSVERINVESVSLSYVGQQIGESRSVCRQCRAADALVYELPLDFVCTSGKRLTLRLNTLPLGRHSVIRNPAHNHPNGSKGTPHFKALLKGRVYSF